MMVYVFTKYGEAYAGWEFTEWEFQDYKIIIQGTKLKEYQKLSTKEKTKEKISEYGWIIPINSIVGTLNSDVFNPTQPHHNSDRWYGEYERKVMFIFGAGASANCVFGDEKDEFVNDVLRPPLGNSLFSKKFDTYYKKYKGVKQSLHQLQDSKVNVEEHFEKEWGNIVKDTNEEMMSRHINIQYYLQDILRDVSENVIEKYFSKNLYAKLAYKLQIIHSSSVKIKYDRKEFKKFAFVSFNQDYILDHFISEHFKKPLNSMDDYVNINDSPFCIFKPHGSSNWGWKFPDTSSFGDNTSSWLFDNKKNFFQLYFELLGNHVNMIDWSTWGHELQISESGLGKHTIDKSQIKIVPKGNANDFYPALLIPYRDKDEFTMPIRHFYNMHTYFSYIETLVIIGWKGNEVAFNRQLTQYSTMLKKVIIADPDAKLVAKNIEPLLKKYKITPIIYENFERFVDVGIDKELTN